MVEDEYTGEPLDKELARRGKAKELVYFNSKGVRRAMDDGKEDNWDQVCSNKGDTENPEIRCRFACQEVKTHKSEDFFVSTPPIETLRLVVKSAWRQRAPICTGDSGGHHAASSAKCSWSRHPRPAKEDAWWDSL